MFLRTFVEIGVPAPAAAELLRRLPQTLIESFAVEATAHGNGVLAEVGPVGAHRPAQLESDRAEAVLTSLEGELEAAALGRDLTQLGLSARYTPPFGALGIALDRLFLHRIAEATVQDFVQLAADAIEDGVALMQLASPITPRVAGW